MYTIAYHLHSTRLHVYTRASLTEHPRDDPRAEVDEDVRIGVGVCGRVGAVECQLKDSERKEYAVETKVLITGRTTAVAH